MNTPIIGITILLFSFTIRIACGQSNVISTDQLEAHLKARALAEELVATIFNVQLRHLEENGLKNAAIYSEIRDSRDRVNQLATGQMTQLTLLLQNLEVSSTDSRAKLLGESRVAARRIAVAMMGERQRLRGRLRTSHTLELLRQMIAAEERAMLNTQVLASRSDTARLPLAEQVVQTHMDLSILFKELALLLEGANATVGPERVSIAATISHLSSSRTHDRIGEVADLVQASKYAEALELEQQILLAFQEAMRLMQSGDELEQVARRQALETIAGAVQQQEELRRRTDTTKLADSHTREELAAQQGQLASQLELLREPLSLLATVGEQLQAASDAAAEAVTHLSDGEREQAIERQETVLGMLEEISQHLSAEASDPEALAMQAAQLEELSNSLGELLETQSDATELAATDVSSAAELESAIADGLAEADDASQLSNGVESKLDDAREAVAKAEQALDDASPSAEKNRLEAVANAESALMEAAAEVQSQLSDVQHAMEAASPSEANPSSDSASKNEASSGTTRDSGSTTVSDQDLAVESRSLEDEAWFARLPASLKNRILAATRRPPPRGYEAKLQRYFQSED
ncbi:MAG: hypothetical protein H6822_15190 [Planctomycetaceae bacterium]|nr:hypothetical protein [Planctomycetales bacterium]MCB9923526.1 hypothetical protein [Planctomycetaceae bacterium]